jgi:hypothetical protein
LKGSRVSKTKLYHDDILMKDKTPKLSEKAIDDDDDDDENAWAGIPGTL